MQKFCLILYSQTAAVVKLEQATGKQNSWRLSFVWLHTSNGKKITSRTASDNVARIGRRQLDLNSVCKLSNSSNAITINFESSNSQNYSLDLIK